MNGYRTNVMLLSALVFLSASCGDAKKGSAEPEGPDVPAAEISSSDETSSPPTDDLPPVLDNDTATSSDVNRNRQLDGESDGESEDGSETLNTYYFDGDHDSYGDPAVSVEAATPPPDYVANNADCDDGDGTVYPGALDLCDGKANDCNSMEKVDGQDEPNFLTDCTPPEKKPCSGFVWRCTPAGVMDCVQEFGPLAKALELGAGLAGWPGMPKIAWGEDAFAVVFTTGSGDQFSRHYTRVTVTGEVVLPPVALGPLGSVDIAEAFGHAGVVSGDWDGGHFKLTRITTGGMLISTQTLASGFEIPARAGISSHATGFVVVWIGLQEGNVDFDVWALGLDDQMSPLGMPSLIDLEGYGWGSSSRTLDITPLMTPAGDEAYGVCWHASDGLRYRVVNALGQPITDTVTIPNSSRSPTVAWSGNHVGLLRYNTGNTPWLDFMLTDFDGADVGLVPLDVTGPTTWQSYNAIAATTDSFVAVFEGSEPGFNEAIYVTPVSIDGTAACETFPLNCPDNGLGVIDAAWVEMASNGEVVGIAWDGLGQALFVPIRIKPCKGSKPISD